MKRLLLAAIVVSGCGRKDHIVVGAKNFTESDLWPKSWRSRSNAVLDCRSSAAAPRGTFVCDRAIKDGNIDLYVEYNGTAFTAILKQRPISDPDSVYRFVAATYARQFQLQWTAPLGFNNTFAILYAARMRSATACGRLAISPHGARWRAGFGYEFLERADGFPGLAKVYGLTFSRPPSAMDLGLTYRALAAIEWT